VCNVNRTSLLKKYCGSKHITKRNIEARSYFKKTNKIIEYELIALGYPYLDMRTKR
jgi:hypothetical protein